MTYKIEYFQWLSWKFQKDAINPWKAFGEVGQKSWGAAEGKAEEACEVSNHFKIEQRFLSRWPRSLTHCGKISGKAKTVVKDADVPKSLKVTLRMASKCGVSRFWKLVGRFLVLSCKHVHFFLNWGCNPGSGGAGAQFAKGWGAGGSEIWMLFQNKDAGRLFLWDKTQQTK